jgi:hypothetical protein
MQRHRIDGMGQQSLTSIAPANGMVPAKPSHPDHETQAGGITVGDFSK